MQADNESFVPHRWRHTFLAARTALCSDDIATAKPLFDELANALPDNAEVRLYAAWARARLADAIDDHDREELEHLARQLLGNADTFALPLCILAHAAVRRGELRAARRLFRRAAQIDDALIDARRGVRLVERVETKSRAPSIVPAGIWPLRLMPSSMGRSAAR